MKPRIIGNCNHDCNVVDCSDLEEEIRSIPKIGKSIPKGWVPYKDALFVDNSGFGGSNELALTLDQFKRQLVSMVDKAGFTLAFGITDIGQFQLYIQAFKRAKKGDSHAG